MITGIAHVNLTVPPGTLDQANEFYANTLGFHRVPVPHLQRDTLAWFDITPKGQQIHIAFSNTPNDMAASRHPCFKLESPQALLECQQRVYEHFERGDAGAPKMADKPGEQSSGAQGIEYPKRFFARDFAGNRLEFSV
ncbi:glyoxalase family protein [Rhizodiscina lignyota]|uniref:Glyoxalase family protein n=1 Tax=Rhizodiscina lignyota TaxID=1504668 RepID=A0A9P4IDV8_9PEZI|nr:glyoxalase family protein [Rhizodiscina lignyota]